MPAEMQAQAEAELDAELAEMLAVVVQAGPAQWQHTEPMTADEHGAAFAQMVRDTAEQHGLGDEPRPVHWLSVGGDLSLAFVGSSPNSPHLARALCGAWNRLVDDAPAMLSALARPVPAQAAADAAEQEGREGCQALVHIEAETNDSRILTIMEFRGVLTMDALQDIEGEDDLPAFLIPGAYYLVPIERESSDAEGSYGDIYHHLDWDGAEQVELCTSCARTVPVDDVVKVVMDDSASVPMCPKCAAHDARLRALADALEVK